MSLRILIIHSHPLYRDESVSSVGFPLFSSFVPSSRVVLRMTLTLSYPTVPPGIIHPNYTRFLVLGTSYYEQVDTDKSGIFSRPGELVDVQKEGPFGFSCYCRKGKIRFQFLI